MFFRIPYFHRINLKPPVSRRVFEDEIKHAVDADITGVLWLQTESRAMYILIMIVGNHQFEKFACLAYEIIRKSNPLNSLLGFEENVIEKYN